MNENPPKPKKPLPRPVPLNRKARRSMKRERLKLIQGGKLPEAPQVDMSTPAGHFAFALHQFMIRYLAQNPDLPQSDTCAAALQVAATFGVQMGGNATEFRMAAEHFFCREEEARDQSQSPPPTPPPGAAG